MDKREQFALNAADEVNVAAELMTWAREHHMRVEIDDRLHIDASGPPGTEERRVAQALLARPQVVAALLLTGTQEGARKLLKMRRCARQHGWG